MSHFIFSFSHSPRYTKSDTANDIDFIYGRKTNGFGILVHGSQPIFTRKLEPTCFLDAVHTFVRKNRPLVGLSMPGWLAEYIERLYGQHGVGCVATFSQKSFSRAKMVGTSGHGWFSARSLLIFRVLNVFPLLNLSLHVPHYWILHVPCRFGKSVNFVISKA
uniref:Uncharacterized protein n=1 Tax=Ditylenchus dipsaci TaxID=166011 RepID=A0A915E5J8_9BILA